MANVTITSSRQFRVGRVLIGGDHDTVLVNSPAPRTWQVVRIPHDRTKPFRYRSVSSRSLKADYAEYTNHLRAPINAYELDQVVKRSKVAFSLKEIPFPVRMALVRKPPKVTSKVYTGVYTGAPLTAGPPPPPFVTAAAAAFSEKVKAALSDPLLSPEGEPVVKDEPKRSGIKRDASTFDAPSLPTAPYWYESEEDRRITRDYINLVNNGFVVNLMIAGPSGSGKTKGVEKLGEELGYPVHIVNCQAITTPEKWLGQMMADPTTGTHFEPSQHIQWVEGTHPDCIGSERCILLYDEITRLRAELNNMTYSLFDTQRGLEVPQMGRRILMAEKNIVIATANIGAAYAGTFGQDRAFRERFAMTLERNFPPRDEEIKIIRSYTDDKISEKDAEALAKIAEASRNLWIEQVIESPISTRTLNNWALLVAGGYDIMTAANYTVLPLYSEDGGPESDRARIRLQIEGKVA